MNRRVVWVIGGWCVAAVLLAAVATAGPVHLWHAPRLSAGDTTTSVPVATAPAETTPPPTPASPGHVPGWIATAIEIIAIAVFVSLIVAVLRSLWGGRRGIGWRWRRRERIPPDSILPDVETTIADDASAQREVLEYGDVRDAIVACWLRLEAAVEAAGVARRASDTSTDLVTRVLGEHAVDASALQTLAALFREARFSSHTMREGQRETALAALARIHASLGVRREAVGSRG